MRIDWSARGRARIYVVTAAGTAICIALAFLFDSYSIASGEWRWGGDPINNFLIPLLIAPPFFLLFMTKLRELAIAHHELMTIAMTDSLTSLLNRRAFTEMVDAYLKRVARSPNPSHDGLLLIDVDHFKQVNDRYGHENGDQALSLIANTIIANVRETDLVGRMGGEEFGVLLPSQSEERISAVAERIRGAVAEAYFAPAGAPHALSVSVGGVMFSQGFTFIELYRSADELLYVAKRNGRNRVELTTVAPAAHSFDLSA